MSAKWNVIELEYKPRTVENVVATFGSSEEAFADAAERAAARIALKQADGRTVIAYTVEEK